MAGKTVAKSPEKGPKFVTARQLAVVFGVSSATIYDWTRKGIIKKTTGRKYNVEESKRRKELWDQKQDAAREKQREDAEAGAVPAGLAPNMLAAWENARLLRVRTQHERLRLAKLQGRVVDRDAINKAMGEVLTLLKSQLRSLGGQAAPLVIGLESIDQIRQVIDAQIERLLARLSETQVVEFAAGGDGEAWHGSVPLSLLEGDGT